MENGDIICYLQLDDKIEELNLSKKTYNALHRANVKTIGDLINLFSEGKIEKIRNIGSTSLEEIKLNLKQKANITMTENEIAEKLNLSKSATSKLVNKFNITTLDELLEISLKKYDYYHLDPSINIDKEIIDRVHSLGLKFKEEEKKIITLKDNIKYLNISNRSFNRLNITIEELLKFSFDEKDRNSILRVKGIGVKCAKEIIDRVHSLGFKFDFEDQKKDKMMKDFTGEAEKIIIPQDNISKLGFHHVLTYRMQDYGINTIEDLLNLSINPNAPGREKNIYNIKGFGETRVK